MIKRNKWLWMLNGLVVLLLGIILLPVFIEVQPPEKLLAVGWLHLKDQESYLTGKMTILTRELYEIELGIEGDWTKGQKNLKLMMTGVKEPIASYQESKGVGVLTTGLQGYESIPITSNENVTSEKESLKGLLESLAPMMVCNRVTFSRNNLKIYGKCVQVDLQGEALTKWLSENLMTQPLLGLSSQLTQMSLQVYLDNCTRINKMNLILQTVDQAEITVSLEIHKK